MNIVLTVKCSLEYVATESSYLKIQNYFGKKSQTLGPLPLSGIEPNRNKTSAGAHI